MLRNILYLLKIYVNLCMKTMYLCISLYKLSVCLSVCLQFKVKIKPFFHKQLLSYGIKIGFFFFFFFFFFFIIRVYLRVLPASSRGLYGPT